jgi:hypothetical protein
MIVKAASTEPSNLQIRLLVRFSGRRHSELAGVVLRIAEPFLQTRITYNLRRWDASALTQRGRPLDVLISVAL